MKRTEIECTKDLSAKPKNNNYNRVLLQPLDQIATVEKGGKGRPWGLGPSSAGYGRGWPAEGRSRAGRGGTMAGQGATAAAGNGEHSLEKEKKGWGSGQTVTDS